MLEALKHSQEDSQLKNLAKSYVGGVKGHLARARKIKEGIIPPSHSNRNGNGVHGTPASVRGAGAGAGASSRSPPVIDLSEK